MLSYHIHRRSLHISNYNNDHSIIFIILYCANSKSIAAFQ